MKKRYLWISALVLLIVPLVTSCVTVYKEPPRITKEFAVSVPYGYGKHFGVDYEAVDGTPIIASADGTVKRIMDRGSIPW